MKREHVPAESSTLELLAAVETVSKFQEPDIVLCDRINQVACSPELAKSEFVVVLVVEDIDERGQEGMKILVPTRIYDRRVKCYQKIGERTSSIGNSFRMAPSFSSKLSCVNLTLRI